MLAPARLVCRTVLVQLPRQPFKVLRNLQKVLGNLSVNGLLGLAAAALRELIRVLSHRLGSSSSLALNADGRPRMGLKAPPSGGMTTPPNLGLVRWLDNPEYWGCV